MILLGSFTYLNTDVRAYFIVTKLIYQPVSVYTNPQSVYPPLFYAILAIIFFPVVAIWGLHSLSELTMTSVGLVKAVVVGAVTAFVALGLAQMESPEDRRWWLLITILNPFLILTTVLLGQADSFVALGFLAGIIGWQSDRAWMASVGFAFAAAIKMYPIFAFVPLVWHYRTRFAEILAGALPIFTITGGLFLFQLPTAAYTFIDRSHPFGLHDASVTPLSAAYIPKLVFGTESYTTLLFIAVIISTVVWATWGRFQMDEVRPLVAVAPSIYVYGYNPSYRWLPFVICASYIGLQHRDGPSLILRRYAVGLSILGIVPPLLVIGSRNLMGTPVLHTTIGTLSQQGLRL